MSGQGPAASTSSDVVRSVVALLIQAGDVAAANDGGGGTARVFHGEEYVDQNDTPPRYVFVLGEGGGSIGPVLEIGARQIASVTETVAIHVWGAGPSDDARTDDAKARAHRILAAFKVSGVGRLTGKVLSREQIPQKLRRGEEYALALSYVWAVPRDAKIEAAAVALGMTSQSPPDPDRPLGPNGNVYGVDVEPTNLRS